jgi:hypothetical protein
VDLATARCCARIIAGWTPVSQASVSGEAQAATVIELSRHGLKRTQGRAR